MNQTIEVDEIEPGWLNTEQAAARMRLSRRQFETRWKSGDLAFARYKQDGDRQYYYDPKDLATADLDDMREVDILDTPTAALLAQAYGHNELMMKQHIEMTRQLLAHATDENQKLRDRCNQLEQTNIDMIRAREEMLNDQHARDLATKEIEQSAERKDKALTWLMQVAPQIMQTHIASKMNTKAVGFLQSITIEQIMMLLELNKMSDESEPMLSDEQVQMLEALLAQKQAQQQSKQPEAESVSESGENNDPSE